MVSICIATKIKNTTNFITYFTTYCSWLQWVIDDKKYYSTSSY